MISMLNWVAGVAFILAPIAGDRWHNDYGVAFRSTKEAQRPLLVVLDTHARRLAHIEPVSQSSRVDDNALLEKFTLCHIDVTTPYGRTVAESFRAKTFPTTVIIDKSASVKLVTKVGKMNDQELHSMLVKYQSGELPAVAASPVVCKT
ncbi:MAG TPA: hypothetical protein VND64_02635 [Pirellulales bacterium]|nr:hypothetical protein [Pirellulales bacterium]